ALKNVIKWIGTDREWGERILRDFGARLMEADSQMDALNRAAKVYVNSRGKPFKPRSVWQSLQNRKDIERK
ncbi:MAG: hypothetical protein ACRD2L_20180, partial [Terriglobia bacterium]